MVGRLQMLQNSRNMYIHIQQNIFVFKASFYIVLHPAKKYIYSFQEHRFIHKITFILGNYIRSRNYIHFKEDISSFKEIIFIQL